ncbi:MAG: PorT family protein, partial [Bacteroidetes bacterium]|nr:PorT family protein [Bacteroidota bacterium]
MIKTYLAAAVLLLVSVAGYTQENDPKLPFFEFGPKIGVNINKIDGQPFKQEFNYGYSAGLFAAVKLGRHWQFAPEVLFNQYATRTDTAFGNIFDVKNVHDVKLNYLSVPVLLNYCPSKVFAFQFGPQFGVL